MKNGVFWIAVLEDTPRDSNRLKGFIDRYAQEHGIEVKTTVFSDGPDLLENYNRDFDVLLLDIELPTLNGMTVSERIREKDSFIPIIFITNLAQYAIRGYEVDALGFMVKPVSFVLFSNYFTKAIAKCRRNEKLKENRVIALGGANNFRKVFFDDIIYIVKDRNYIVYQFTNQQTFKERGTMKNVLPRFENTSIKQCSSGCMVNLRHVSKLVGGDVHLQGIVFPVSLPFRNSFAHDLMDYIRGT